MHTSDGLGVINKSDLNGKHQGMELKRQQSLKLEDVQRFFYTASNISKLGFLRDAQSKGLIYDNELVKMYLNEQLLMEDIGQTAFLLLSACIRDMYRTISVFLSGLPKKYSN